MSFATLDIEQGLCSLDTGHPAFHSARVSSERTRLYLSTS